MTNQNNQNNEQDNDMSTLTACTASLTRKGYEENFEVTEEGLRAPSKEKHYQPKEVKIDNFYRFEGASDPADNSVLYAITTNDGVRGMLVSAYGAYANDEDDKFIKQVEEIQKVEAKDTK